MTKPVIVTGCGRSGTHWLGHILKAVLGEDAAAWEPSDHKQPRAVVVDSRLRFQAQDLQAEGHRIVHLVRDGRDVVRSLHKWYQHHNCLRANYDGTMTVTTSSGKSVVSFEECCYEWAVAVDLMDRCTIMRIEDLTLPEVRDSQAEYSLPHWTGWTAEQTATFWRICGDQMASTGYER